MKQFFFAAALLGATAITSFAQHQFPAPPSAEALAKSKTDMISATNQMEADFNAKKLNKGAAEARHITVMMVNHIQDTRHMANVKTGADRDVLMKRVIQLEGRYSSYYAAG